MALVSVLNEVRACTLCEEDRPLSPRPTVSIYPGARSSSIGQAPGTKVQGTSIAWNDPSGERLRDWMQINQDIFYDAARIAIMPRGFCSPGRLARGGDKSPRPEGAPTWHDGFWQTCPTWSSQFWSGSAHKSITWAVTRKRP